MIIKRKLFADFRNLPPELVERVKSKRKVLAGNLSKVRKELAADEAKLMEEAKMWKKGVPDSLTGISGGDHIAIRGDERNGLGTWVSVNRKPKESRSSLFKRYMEGRKEAISKGTKNRAEAAVKEAKQEALEERLGIPKDFRSESLIKPRKS